MRGIFYLSLPSKVAGDSTPSLCHTPSNPPSDLHHQSSSESFYASENVSTFVSDVHTAISDLLSHHYSDR